MPEDDRRAPTAAEAQRRMAGFRLFCFAMQSRLRRWKKARSWPLRAVDQGLSPRPRLDHSIKGRDCASLSDWKETWRVSSAPNKKAAKALFRYPSSPPYRGRRREGKRPPSRTVAHDRRAPGDGLEGAKHSYRARGTGHDETAEAGREPTWKYAETHEATAYAMAYKST